MAITATVLRPYSKDRIVTTATSTQASSATSSEQVVAVSSPGQCLCRYALSSAAAQTFTEKMVAPGFIIRLTQNAINMPLVPGSVSFTWGGRRYVDRQGVIMRDPDPLTGAGSIVGSINYLTGEVTLDVYDGGANTLTVHSLLGRLGSQFCTQTEFRLPSCPVRPGSFALTCVSREGVRISATAGYDGRVKAQHIDGYIDNDTGIVTVGFGDMIDDSPVYADEPWYDPDLVDEETGKVWKPMPVYADSLEYLAVVYSYIPLSADLLGLNPVRLPSDGRVVVVKPGDVVVIHNTKNLALGQGLPAAGQSFSLPRAADSVEVYDSADPPLRVPTTEYSHEAGSGSLVFADPLDLAAFTPPLVANHRIEEMMLVAETQINGQISLGRSVAKPFPAEETFVSTSLNFGDLRARAYGMFDQRTWNNTWSDDLIGDAANATYNEIDYPVKVLNSGAVKERWALVFTSTMMFNIIAEKRGIVGTGYISQDCQPLNNNTGKPYFFIDYRGWGVGWAAGNAVRFNTDGASAPIWFVRTTLQAPPTEPEDHFTVQLRGDAQ